jgi:hypothetical protein
MARALVNGHEVRLSAVSPDRTVQTSVMAAYAYSPGGRGHWQDLAGAWQAAVAAADRLTHPTATGRGVSEKMHQVGVEIPSHRTYGESCRSCRRKATLAWCAASSPALAGGADGWAAAGVFVFGGDVADAFVQPHGVVVAGSEPGEFASSSPGSTMRSRCGCSALRWPKNDSIQAWSLGVAGRPKCWATPG